jgi:hypothetical protein
MGLQGMVNSINDLSSNITSVLNSLSALKITDRGNGGDLQATYDAGTDLLNSIALLPSAGPSGGQIGDKMPSITYNIPYSTSPTDSLFPDILDVAPNGSGSLQILYSVIEGINDQGIKAIGDNVQKFSEANSDGTLSSTIS